MKYKRKCCGNYHFSTKNKRRFAPGTPKSGAKGALKILLRGREILRKKSWVVFEKNPKNMVFSIFEKKLFEIFWVEKFPIFFLIFFAKDVLKTLLRGRETFKKKYREVFEKFQKNMVFWASKWPVRPSTVNTSSLSGGTPELEYRAACGDDWPHVLPKFN